MSHDFHLSDADLLKATDGELSHREAARVESHLAACWACRARKQELEATIGAFVRFQRSEAEIQIPAADGPRALLRAQIRQLEQSEPNRARRWSDLWNRRLTWASVLAGLLVAGAGGVVGPRWFVYRATNQTQVTVPIHALTPGATIALSQREVCQQKGVSNKEVPIALQNVVFAEYGIHSAQPDAYEVDYLITPGLGGADDIHNLWPESNRATRWNAQVKDALEDHLRDLVCEGQIDLQTAQRDLANNWIDAYKKYFHTDQPLPATH